MIGPWKPPLSPVANSLQILLLDRGGCYVRRPLQLFLLEALPNLKSLGFEQVAVGLKMSRDIFGGKYGGGKKVYFLFEANVGQVPTDNCPASVSKAASSNLRRVACGVFLQVAKRRYFANKDIQEILEELHKKIYYCPSHLKKAALQQEVELIVESLPFLRKLNAYLQGLNPVLTVSDTVREKTRLIKLPDILSSFFEGFRHARLGLFS
jgi:hypothetical protein